MENDRTVVRRDFLVSAAGLGAGLILASSSAQAKPAARSEKAPDQEDEISPTEDLMREHGILRRVLLIYEEVMRRFETHREVSHQWVAESADIIRNFIEDYHEKDEEDFIFPRLEKAGKLVDLVGTLRQQHKAGRLLTMEISKLSTATAIRNPSTQQQMSGAMRMFIRMYQPHAAREDTVLFPAFRQLVGEKELDKLKDIFEDKEKALPHGGFEKMAADVTKLEQALGIYDLAQFTPR